MIYHHWPGVDIVGYVSPMKFLLGFTLIILSASSAHADDLASSDFPWCPPVESWSISNWGSPDLLPNGGLVTVGERTFRSCTSPHNLEGPRIVRLTINPMLISKSLNRHAWTTLTLSDALPRGKWKSVILSGYIAVGKRIFGDITYREYRHRELVEVEHSTRIFVYEPGLNAGHDQQPDHAITCPDRSPREGGGVTCFVFVFYEDIRASIMMIGDGREFLPLPRNEFSQIARDMIEVLRISDVTGRLSSFKGTLPRFD